MTRTTSCSLIRYKSLLTPLYTLKRELWCLIWISVVLAAVGTLLSLHGHGRENHQDRFFLENPVFRVRAGVYIELAVCVRVW